ncbi:MAG: GNAT family N-acetyltransferase [Myxococcota bacterium]|nr:GNAT family N-acetyltransferase [Myxococcota bacterium]
MELIPLSPSPAEHEEFLDALAAYWDELQTFSGHPEELIRTEYRRHLLHPGNRRFVWAVQGGRRIGFCVYLVVEHWYRSDILEGYIDELYIRPDARRIGRGREFMAQVMERCRQEGCQGVRLHVLPRNTRARRFWESVGFEEELLKMSREIQDPLQALHSTRSFPQVLAAHLEAVSSRNLEAYAATISEANLTVVMPFGKILRGREEVLAFHRGWFADLDWTWTPRVLETRELGDTRLALVEVDYRDLDREQRPTSQRLLLTLTFAREAGGWRLVHDQNTAVR